MAKKDFINKFNKDYAFRSEMRAKGIRVIQNNVIFFNPDGSLKYIAGNYIKQFPLATISISQREVWQNMENKITKKEKYMLLKGIVEKSSYKDKAGMLDFLDHEIYLLNKKSTSKSKVDSELENEVLSILKAADHDLSVSDILSHESVKTYTVKESGKEVIKNTSNQKMTAVLKKLTNDKKIIRIEDKKKAYFRIASDSTSQVVLNIPSTSNSPSPKQREAVKTKEEIFKEVFGY